MTDPEFADRTTSSRSPPRSSRRSSNGMARCGAPDARRADRANLVMTPAERGVVGDGVELIGANAEAIARRDRERFKQAMTRSASRPGPGTARSLTAMVVTEKIGSPCHHPARAHPRWGTGIAATPPSSRSPHGLDASLISEIRSSAGSSGGRSSSSRSCVTRRQLRSCARSRIRSDGRATRPDHGRSPRRCPTSSTNACATRRSRSIRGLRPRQQHPVAVSHDRRSGRDEMNPRVSRSSALAPKATGFHRKDALAFVSVRPDEIPNDITARRRQASSPRSTTS